MPEDQNRAALEAFVDWCRDERERATTSLKFFEAGVLKIGATGPSGLIDGSKSAMEHLRGVISDMNKLIADHEGRHA